MRFSRMLRRHAEVAPILAQEDFLRRVAAYIEALEAALNRYRQVHDAICIGSAQKDSTPCNCGAIIYNRLIDNLLANGEMDSSKREYQ